MSQNCFAYILHFTNTNTDLNSRVFISAICSLHLSDGNRLSQENSPSMREAICRKDTGHFFFLGENEFHFVCKSRHSNRWARFAGGPRGVIAIWLLYTRDKKHATAIAGGCVFSWRSLLNHLDVDCNARGEIEVREGLYHLRRWVENI